MPNLRGRNSVADFFLEVETAIAIKPGRADLLHADGWPWTGRRGGGAEGKGSIYRSFNARSLCNCKRRAARSIM
ncbi:hypothetical protein EVAR_85273_1 [Eumeta japonica]|uniref:Uncharacterized protein n=1 Tax=Eumeta variegata TaxID=151549 RepID=A0A4C1V6W8_EUMVA|nr:hypothetical protein EVAR_85273_1 [Eumeta japonica]